MLKDGLFTLILLSALFIAGCTKKKEPDLHIQDLSGSGNQGVPEKPEGDSSKTPHLRILPEWQKKEIQELSSMRKSFQGANKITLVPFCVGSFDGKTILLGGSYSAPWGNCRSFLLISRDGGQTWKDSRVWLAGSSVVHIQWFDSLHGWFITGRAFGSGGAPYYVFSTRDGGQTWKRSPQGLPEKGGLFWPTHFTFTDPDKGLVSFLKESREWLTYQTEDGGITWYLKERKEIKLEISWGEFQLKNPYKKIYKITTDYGKSEIRLFQFDNAAKKWTPFSTLPLHFRIQGENLVVEKKGKPKGKSFHWK